MAESQSLTAVYLLPSHRGYSLAASPCPMGARHDGSEEAVRKTPCLLQPPTLADRERLRVDNDVILKLRIVDRLSGQISFGLEYRSDTPDGAEHTDTATRAAVVYDF